MKTNYLICRGDACKLRFSCQRFQNWLNSDDTEESEMEPDYRDGECPFFALKREYYGG